MLFSLNLNNPDIPQIAESISTQPGISQKNITITSTTSSFNRPIYDYSTKYLANEDDDFSCGSGATEPLHSSFQHQPSPAVAQHYVNPHQSPFSKPPPQQHQPHLSRPFEPHRPFEGENFFSSLNLFSLHFSLYYSLIYQFLFFLIICTFFILTFRFK